MTPFLVEIVEGVWINPQAIRSITLGNDGFLTIAYINSDSVSMFEYSSAADIMGRLKEFIVPTKPPSHRRRVASLFY